MRRGRGNCYFCGRGRKREVEAASFSSIYHFLGPVVFKFLSTGKVAETLYYCRYLNFSRPSSPFRATINIYLVRKLAKEQTRVSSWETRTACSKLFPRNIGNLVRRACERIKIVSFLPPSPNILFPSDSRSRSFQVLPNFRSPINKFQCTGRQLRRFKNCS